MLRFSVLVPDATVNYAKNPALRYNTTDWSSAGSTITRSFEQARFGIASLKVVTNGSATREGCFYRVNTLTGIDDVITGSAYVRGAGSVRLRVIINPTGQERYSSTVLLRSDRWTRLSATVRGIGSNDVRVYVELDESAAKVRTFYVDGMQVERKAYPTTYCDGEQTGCRWNGTYHSSTSQRSAYTRAGGRWVQLVGEKRAEKNLYMTVAGGLGVSPLTNNIQEFAFAPGAFYQNTKVNVRVVTLTFFAKHGDQNSTNRTVALSALHQLRQFLVDIMKPDKTVGGEEMLFEYQDGDKALYFRARYDGGLEGEWDVRNEWVNSFPVRLIAASPMIYEDSQETAVLDIQDQITSVAVVFGRINGAWNNLAGGLSSTFSINKLRIGPDGKVYAVGKQIKYWNGTAWILIGNGTTNAGATIFDLAVAANGDIYAVGSFTTVDGVAANRIAKWNGSAWSALGTGLNGVGNTLKIAPNGDLYVGGNFTTAGGVACVNIALWDGLQWRRVGQYGGLNGSNVYAIEISPDGSTLYAGGDFTDQNGLAASALLRVAQYNVSTGLFSAMGSGFSQSGGSPVTNVLYLSKTGILYAGGLFTTSGSVTVNRIAQWNGSVWTALLTGLDNEVKDIRETKEGYLFITGSFLNAGSLPGLNMVFWNGTTFYNQDIYPTFAGGGGLVTCLVDPSNNDLYVGGIADDTLRCAGFVTFTNPGTAESYPLLYFVGPGSLYFIENQTTGKRIYLNLTLLNLEEIFIDTGKGTIKSATRGDIYYTLVPGSDFHSFTILPGENKIATFLVKDVGAQGGIYFTPQHWSIDATQNEESL